MTKKELAIENHNKGYNCCQAVACSFSDEIGIEESILFKACEGFGLGMGCTECTCGAISGAIMIAGLKNSTANLNGTKSKAATYQISKEIVNRFKEKNGATICKELKGIESGKVLRSCEGCIEDATELVETIVKL